MSHDTDPEAAEPHERQTVCPIERAVAVVGDRWTMLILRELPLGNDRFDGLQAQTGMSSNLLAQRLKAMEANGLIERSAYQERPKRFRYQTTGKGRELDPILLALRAWGQRHCDFSPTAAPAMDLTYRSTGARIESDWRPSMEDPPFTFRDTTGKISRAWAAERQARHARFSARRLRRKK